MSGTFELISNDLGEFRVLLVAGDGEVLASSGPYADQAAVVAGIASVREIAGTGLIVDRTGLNSQQSPHIGQQAPCASHSTVCPSERREAQPATGFSRKPSGKAA